MAISRRAFIQAGIVGGAALSAFGFDIAPLQAQAKTLKIERTTETRIRPAWYREVTVRDPRDDYEQARGAPEGTRPRRRGVRNAS